MTPRMDKIEDQTDTAAIAQRARELFARWTAEEEAGYEGEVSWEEFKKALDEERPSHRELFPER